VSAQLNAPCTHWIGVWMDPRENAPHPGPERLRIK